jgi:hypothetical protein
MCRQHVSTGKPELEQIAPIANVHLTPTFDIQKYWDGKNAEH